jgi:hypothetical protein
MAAGLATRARLHPVPRRPRGTRPTCILNQDRKGSFFLRVFAVMAQLSRASRGRYRPSRDRPEKKTKRRPLTACSTRASTSEIEVTPNREAARPVRCDLVSRLIPAIAETEKAPPPKVFPTLPEFRSQTRLVVRYLDGWLRWRRPREPTARPTSALIAVIRVPRYKPTFPA